METELKIGSRYSLKEILDLGFTNVNNTSLSVSYKKGSLYMSFGIPGNRRPRKYKLLSIADIK